MIGSSASNDARAPGEIRAHVEGDEGFLLGLHLSTDELAEMKALIEAQWLEVLRRHNSNLAERFREIGIDRYHELAPLVDHAALWPKAVRMFSPQMLVAVRRTTLLQRLSADLGAFAISDEEKLGRENVYWRLVRPGHAADMGPLHADRWFWDLGHGVTPAHHQRMKLWVAVVSEPGLSGLRVVPGSHRRSLRYHGVLRHGTMKPQLDEREEDLDIRLIPTAPGDAIVFHDRLLHGGAINRGQLTRVSFELTMFVPS